MKRFRRCVLHIGTEKTGTTTIQSFLAGNRGALAEDGVVYVKEAGRNGNSQTAFAICAEPSLWEKFTPAGYDPGSQEDLTDWRKLFSENIQAEFDALPHVHTWVISCEHFQSRLRNVRSILALKEFLSPWVENFEVVLYLRRQDRMALSAYSTKLKSGWTGDGNSVLVSKRGKNGKLPYYFDYETLYRNWSKVFGDASMVVRIFDRAEFVGGDLLQDFCAAAGLLYAGKRIPVTRNESLSKEATDFIYAMNKQLPHTEGRKNPFRASMVRLVSEAAPGKGVSVSRREAENFYSTFRESNERLRRLAFPQRDAPLFSEDFSDYPSTVESAAPRYEDAVAIAVEIVRLLQQSPVPQADDSGRQRPAGKKRRWKIPGF